MTRIKQPRVSVIKNNLQVGQAVPVFNSDAGLGMWIDKQYEDRGHKIDHRGDGPDFEEYGIDNKSRKKGTNSAHTVGSISIKKIIANPSIFDTSLWGKIANQNQITVDTDFNEIANVELVDFDQKHIRDCIQEAYASCREQLINATKVVGQELPKNITSDNNWAIFDGYGKIYGYSYRFRILPATMKKMKTIAQTRDSFGKLFEETK
jgi:hypothetical protein